MNTNTRHWASITAGILSLAGYASAASLGSEKYTYDASGNIIEKSIDGKVIKMAYDQANRLIGRQADGQGKQSTAYDAAGRPVTERNADDQTSSRSMSYGYGDKVLETKNQNIKAGFYYNAEGQMVGKTTQFKTSIYSWDGNVLAADDLTVFTNEAHVTGGVPIMASDQNVMISDYLGNTLSSGNTQFTSSAYGEGLEQGRFTGKAFLKELGEFVFQHRNYSAETLRWTVTDPSGFPDGKNNFLYVHGDPLTSFDSRGLDTNWIFNGEVTNNTNCSGTNGWTIIISADADTIELKNSSGAQVWKHEGWTEAESDSWKDAADTYIAAHPGATKIIGLSGVQNKDLPAAKSALDIGIEDADFVVSSPHPVSKAECRGAVLTLPAEGKIGWSNWTIYEK